MNNRGQDPLPQAPCANTCQTEEWQFQRADHCLLDNNTCLYTNYPFAMLPLYYAVMPIAFITEVIFCQILIGMVQPGSKPPTFCMLSGY